MMAYVKWFRFRVWPMRRLEHEMWVTYCYSIAMGQPMADVQIGNGMDFVVARNSRIILIKENFFSFAKYLLK